MNILHFEISKESKKQVIKAIEEATGCKAKYLGVPSCAYQIGEYTLNKDCSLTWSILHDADPAGLEQTGNVVDAIVMTGHEPLEWPEFQKQTEAIESMTIEEEKAVNEPISELIITIPKDKMPEQAIENLKKLIESKGTLIKSALRVSDLPIKETDDEVIIDWFKDLDTDHANAYFTFITYLIEFAKTAKRVTAKDKEVDNEKYAFRCFLLRLGFIGEDTKRQRKILMENLTGSAAFKSGKAGE